MRIHFPSTLVHLQFNEQVIGTDAKSGGGFAPGGSSIHNAASPAHGAVTGAGIRYTVGKLSIEQTLALLTMSCGCDSCAPDTLCDLTLPGL